MALDNIPTLGPGGFNGNLDKVLVYKNGGSEVACSLLTLTNSALNVAGVYVDAVNQRVGIGTPSPSSKLTIDGLLANNIGITLQDSGTYRSSYTVGNGGTYIDSWSNGLHLGVNSNNLMKFTWDSKIGVGQSSPTARFQIKGSGSTSATTSLLVENSSGTQLLKVTDDGVVEGGSATATQFKILNKNGLAISRDANLDANIRILEFGGVGPVIKITGNSVPTFKFLDGSNYFCIQTSPDWTGIGQFTTVANSSALLQADSTTKGFLKPRLTTAQKNAIVTPAAGLEVYDTDLNRPCFFNGTSWITL